MRKFIYILVPQLVSALREDGHPLPESSVKFYSDGSLWTADNKVLCVEEEGALRGAPALRGCGSSLFRVLSRTSAAPDTDCSILYPGTCTWLGADENWVLTYPGVLAPVGQWEGEWSSLALRVRLRRRPSEALAVSLHSAIENWYRGQGSVGVFGERGVRAITRQPSISVREFEYGLDAADSGQETLNSIYVSLINWAIERRAPLATIEICSRSIPQ